MGHTVSEVVERSRVERARRACAVVLAVLVVGALGWVVLRTPLLGVDRVSVAGADRVSTDQVVAAAAVPLGTPLARVDVDAVRRRVAALDPVARVQVERGWPSVLRLRVVERTPAVGFLTAGRYVLIDPDGVPFARVPRLPDGTVRLQVARPAADDPSTRSALQVLGELPRDLRAGVGIVRATSPAAVTLLLRDGRQVVWGGPGRSADKAAAAAALLRLPGSVYDVSSPEVVTRREPVTAEGVTGEPQG
ncbi:MAG: peptidase [Frankiales bacterium]|nr:peptidase [Frankiales bacterium]